MNLVYPKSVFILCIFMMRKVAACVDISAKGKVLFVENNENEGFQFLPSEMVKCYYEYPLKIMQPSCAADGVCMWLYPIIFGGGLVEGDYVSITVNINKKCCVLWTSLSFTKVYNCENGLNSQQHWNYNVDSYSLLCIIPDPVMCFKGASYIQTQNVYMTQNSNLVLLDWFTSGRYTRGERWEFSKLNSTFSVFINKTLAFKEALNLQSTPFVTLWQAMKLYNISGTCIVIGPDIMSISLEILAKLGKCSGYGEKLKADTLFAVSPLYFGLNSEICGCVMRFSSVSVPEAYKRIEELLSPLFDKIGSNPFKNK